MIALNIKTSYSLLQSLCLIDKLVAKSSELGYKALAIMDEDNMFGVYEFYLECIKYNIKPIIGLSLSYLDRKLLLYAKNKSGYHNLIKLSTIVSERSITKSDLEKYCEDIILVQYDFDEELSSIFSDNYIGVSASFLEGDLKKCVYVNPIYYLEEEDYKYLDYLHMIKEGKTLGTYPLNNYKNHHLVKNLEIDKCLLTNMEDIANKCNVKIEYTKGLLPIYDDKINSKEHLCSLSHKGLSKRLNDNVPDVYLNRLHYELEVINNMGFNDYFLIVYDYVKFAKTNGILVGPGRGSAAGSLVSYVLGITDIDPIKYNLLFERFLNPERVTMPDIDVDFDASRRGEVIDYVISKYGAKKAVGIITFNTFGAKGVIRDLGKVMNISPSLIDMVSKMMGSSLTNSYMDNNNLKRIVDGSLDLQRLFKIAVKLENIPRHISMHAAGIVISRFDIDEVIPLYKNQLGMYVSSFSMNYLEELGLLKMDFLGLSNLTMISNLIDEINKHEKLNITFNNISLECKKPLIIFNRADTDGIFQFESSGIKSFIKKLKISSFEDIVLSLALYRPGPMDSIDEFIKIKEGVKDAPYYNEDIKKILSPTYGIIVYQEQIMQIVKVLAGYSLGEADILRRAMSKKKESILKDEEPKFIKRAVQNGVDEVMAKKIYNFILKFAGYGFNRSHSVSYAIISYKMAFLKTYFYKYFMTSLLTSALSNTEKTRVYIQNIRSHGEKVLAPNINLSDNAYHVESDGIRCPIGIIYGIGNIVASEIIKKRGDKPFEDFFDFVLRCYSPSVNKKVITNLIYAGCFDWYNIKTLILNIDKVINYVELNSAIEASITNRPIIELMPEYSNEELLMQERSVFGFYLRDHPTCKYKDENSLNTLVISDYFNKNISLILEVNSIKEVITKNNDVMAFIDGDDEVGSVSLTLFPRVYKSYNTISKHNIIRVFGRVEKRFNNYQINVYKIDILES